MDGGNGRGLLAASNTFTNANQGIFLGNMQDLAITDTLPGAASHYLVLEDESGIGTLTGTSLWLSTVSTTTIEGVDLSRAAACTFGGSGTGIYAGNSSHLTVHNVSVANRGNGMVFQSGSDLELTDNDFSGSGCANAAFALQLNGISVDGGNGRGLLAASNTFTNAHQGIFLENVQDLSISNALPVTATHYLRLEDGSGIGAVSNTSLWLSNVSTTTVEKITLSAGGVGHTGNGLYITGGANLTVQAVRAKNRNQAITIQNVTGAVVGCNTLINNNIGLTLNQPSTVLNNRFQDNTTAILMGGGSTLIAENNYWGAANGPKTLGGAGDAYSGNVDADPFLTSAPPCAPQIIYPLTTATTGVGSGSLELNPPGGMYDYGTIVTATATAAVSSTFSGWSGACSGSGACVITIKAAKALTATFSLKSYTLTTATAGSGSITLNPPGGAYPHGTVVTATATADAGFTFSGWSGACTGIGVCVVTMDAAKSVTATFTLIDTTLAVDLTADDPSKNACDDAVAADCSLRGAINKANADPTRAYTIAVPAGSYTLTLAGANEDANATGDLDLRNHITINGAGATSTIIDGNALDRVFHVPAGLAVTVNLNHLTVTGGSQSGGGIHLNQATVTVSNTIFTNNNALGGAALRLQNVGTLNILNSTIHDNTDNNDNGAAAVVSAGNGTLNIVNTTFSNNRAPVPSGHGGGAIVVAPFNTGSVTIRNSTFVNNAAASVAGGISSWNEVVNIQNSLFQNNTPNSCGSAGSGSFSGSNNLIDNSGLCNGITVSAVTNLDPTLADNDGETPTHALLAGSNALDAGTGNCLDHTGTPLLIDQRGITRPQGAACDIGAFERFVPIPTPTPSSTATPTPTQTPTPTATSTPTANCPLVVTNVNDSGAGSLRQAIADANSACNQIVFAAGLSGQTIRLAAQLVIEKNVTIDGSGRRVTISGDTNGDGSGDVAVFTINAGVVTLRNLTIAKGFGADGLGGGVSISPGAHVHIVQSTIRDNISDNGALASAGGGIYNTGVLTLTNSTVSGNQAANLVGLGGGIHSSFGSVATIRYSTITGNRAPDSGLGGGLNVEGGTVTLIGSIVSGNSASAGAEIAVNTGGVLAVNGHNVIGVNGSAGMDGATPGATDLVPASALNTVINPTLADNGGDSATHELVVGGPAHNAIPVNTRGCGTTITQDQRGVTRPASSGCDSGAVELTTAAPTPTPTLPAADATAVAQPDQPASLTYSDPNGGGVAVQIPAGAVDQATTFLYDEQGTPSQPGAFQFAGRTFTLTAYRDNSPLDDFTFQQPITLVIDYTDSDVAGIDENSLTLFFYDEDSAVWSDQGIMVVARDTTNNRLTVQGTHLTEFAMGTASRLYLPIGAKQ